MRRMTPVMLVGAVILGYLAGYMMSPVGSASGQTASPPPAWTTVPLAPNQGETVYWSIDDLRQAHTELAARVASGQPVGSPRDLVELPITPTHAFNFLHRYPRTRPPSAERHEGVTDFYVIVAGSGTLVVGGEIEGQETVPNRPGEYRGQPIRGGHNYRVKAGDMISIPPDTPHLSQPDPGGLTYMLVKINVGRYPWSLIATQR